MNSFLECHNIMMNSFPVCVNKTSIRHSCQTQKLNSVDYEVLCLREKKKYREVITYWIPHFSFVNATHFSSLLFLMKHIIKTESDLSVYLFLLKQLEVKMISFLVCKEKQYQISLKFLSCLGRCEVVSRNTREVSEEKSNRLD